MGKGRPISIDWKEVLSDSGGGGGGVCFADSPSTAGKGKGKGKGKKAAGELLVVSDDDFLKEIAGMFDDGLLKEIAHRRRVRSDFTWFFADGGVENRRRLEACVAEARRRGLDPDAMVLHCAPSSAGVDCKQDADSTAMDAYKFGPQDEQGESASHRFLSKASPVRSRNQNYGDLGVTTRRSLRLGGQRKPIPVENMYSSNPCSSTFSGYQQRIHAIDPEGAGSEKFQQNEDDFSTCSTKRRKAEHQDSSLSEKVRDVVLLDDEDVQHEEPVDSWVPDKWTESKIYYPSRHDPEAIELSNSDIKCLDPGVYLSSPVINYYIQYIKRTKLHNEDCRDKFHIFNTYFYSKLQEALLGKGDFSKFRRWWKGVNIFHRGYIILPIHGTAHWSLIIVCIPAKESNSGPIILHLDSLGMHPSTEIFDTVGRFLVAEWRYLRKNPPADISISETIWEDLPCKIHNEKVQVPRQNNEYDCGIFMLYYIEKFIRDAPERLTKDKLHMFSRSWFKSEVASELRHRIRELLLEELASARLDKAMSETDTSDRSDDEYGINCGESEGITKMIVDDGYNGIGNKDSVEVGASGQVPSSICRSDDKITHCVLSEAATFSDGAKDEYGIKVYSESSKGEGVFAILSPDRSKNSEDTTYRAPTPGIVCDSCDSDMDDVEIVGIRESLRIQESLGTRNRRTKPSSNCWAS